VEGSIGILNRKGDLMTKLKAGAQFGEAGLYGFKKRSMTAKSTAFCIVKVLEFDIFKDVMKSFPTVQKVFTRA
jgi:signal-transduction protein with cAMP-binding, CBS, and nucleotidyltransferase domain